jgi:hypothetical protein
MKKLWTEEIGKIPIPGCHVTTKQSKNNTFKSLMNLLTFQRYWFWKPANQTSRLASRPRHPYGLFQGPTQSEKHSITAIIICG